MNPEIFSLYPRIAEKLFERPWMILPATHAMLVDRLSSYVAADGPKLPAEDKSARWYGALETAGRPRGAWMVNYDNRRAAVPYNMDSETGIGQVVVAGIIGKGLSGMEMSCGGVCVDHVQAALQHLGELGAKQVALHFNTPGGVCTGVHECAEFIADFNSSAAPVHAYTDTMSCSCGYYLMAGCETITAAKTADIGCIGVYCYLNDRSGEWEKMGRVAHLIASGKYKGQGAPGVPLSGEFLAHLREEVDHLFAAFAGHVVNHRGDEIMEEAVKKKKTPEQWAAEIMQGQSWLAEQAPRALFDGFITNRAAHVRALMQSNG